ncbi:MAG: alpha/beta hydrolase fold domain-containing protein [Sedimentisphaerales bacterium]|nr:alpha/beta hydrolase fold domain-containing protein [Sedimentisphaerales bacterium]
MKDLYISIMLFVFFFGFSIASGQDFMETSKPNVPAERREMLERIFSLTYEGLDAVQLNNAIGILEESLKRSDHKYDRYINTFHLTFFYAQAKDYEKCLNLLIAGQEEGFFFPAITGSRIWPEYLNELQKLERFNTWFQENERRRTQARENATAEYFVQTPSGYTKEKTYPLLIVFHGGIDSNINSYIKWQSPRLQSECIVAYLQGNVIHGSFHRSMGSKQEALAKQVYQQITQKYSVDPNRVMVGGASAGGMISATIAQDATIPVTGAILAFPGPPPGLTEVKLRQAAERGLRVALLTGELDGAIKIQKELGVLFDKAGVPNRFVVFPGIGHQYPEDFAAQIDISLKYIWNK